MLPGGMPATSTPSVRRYRRRWLAHVAGTAAVIASLAATACSSQPVASNEPPADPGARAADTPVIGAQEPETHDDSEPDAEEVRRRIAVASRSFDPDHQIRRAMDAFFSPNTIPSDRDQPREH